ncbi:hypothetical protein [Mycoplasma sp. 4423]
MIPYYYNYDDVQRSSELIVENVTYNIEDNQVVKTFNRNFEIEIIRNLGAKKTVILFRTLNGANAVENLHKYKVHIFYGNKDHDIFDASLQRFGLIYDLTNENKQISIVLATDDDKPLRKIKIQENHIKNYVDNLIIKENLAKLLIPYSITYRIHNKKLEISKRYWNVFLTFDDLNTSKGVTTPLKLYVYRDKSYDEKIEKYLPNSTSFDVIKSNYAASFDKDKKEQKIELADKKVAGINKISYNFDFVTSAKAEDAKLIQKIDNSVVVNKNFSGELNSKFYIETNYAKFIIYRKQNFKALSKPSKANSLIIQELPINNSEEFKKQIFKYSVLIEKLYDINTFKLNQWIKRKKNEEDL